MTLLKAYSVEEVQLSMMLGRMGGLGPCDQDTFQGPFTRGSASEVCYTLLARARQHSGVPQAEQPTLSIYEANYGLRKIGISKSATKRERKKAACVGGAHREDACTTRALASTLM